MQTGGVLVSVARYSALEHIIPPPSLRLVASLLLTDSDVALVAAAVVKAAKECL